MASIYRWEIYYSVLKIEFSSYLGISSYLVKKIAQNFMPILHVGFLF